jgi:nicotinate-nucleotide pyrophosphorylase (carboxylating)
VGRDFRQIEWDDVLADDCRQVVRLAVREDLELQQDWTTVALVPPGRTGSADIVARQAGVVAGMLALETALDELGAKLSLDKAVEDRQRVAAGARLAKMSGDVRDLLTCERIMLNLLGRMMGVATLAAEFAKAIEGTGARIYDTRKTTPAWRRLEKYAARCGGACNHRTGLFDAVLIKDNHLAQMVADGGNPAETVAAAVRKARQALENAPSDRSLAELIIEVEVESLDQLKAVLAERPDIVLLDNMSVENLGKAVAIRDELASEVELEASGGVNLATVRAIAEAGVERISVGGITNGAKSLDVALDWAEQQAGKR